MDIDKIIPPADHQHRNEFNNSNMINQLNDFYKKLLEDALIGKMLIEPDDTLLVETLANIKSEKSLPILYNYLKSCSDKMKQLIFPVSIFEINSDPMMINIAVASFEQLDGNKNPYYVYQVIPAFYHLVKLKSSVVNNIIKRYTAHKEILISFNAKEALGLIG